MSFTGLLNQTLSLNTVTTKDRYGRENYSTASDIECRFQKSNKVVLKSNGETQAIDAIIFVNSDCTVNVDDKVTYSNDDYKVVNKNSVAGRNGSIHHIELQVIKWQSN